jgi:hypothetical protein
MNLGTAHISTKFWPDQTLYCLTELITFSLSMITFSLSRTTIEVSCSCRWAHGPWTILFSVCIRLCLQRLTWSHLNGLSPVWISLWRERWNSLLHALLHWSHQIEWPFSCMNYVNFHANILLQSLHLNGFYPEWTHFLCLYRSVFLLNAISHWSHLNGLSPVWIRLWEGCVFLWMHCCTGHI